MCVGWIYVKGCMQCVCMCVEGIVYMYTLKFRVWWCVCVVKLDALFECVCMEHCENMMSGLCCVHM